MDDCMCAHHAVLRRGACHWRAVAGRRRQWRSELRARGAGAVESLAGGAGRGHAHLNVYGARSACAPCCNLRRWALGAHRCWSTRSTARSAPFRWSARWRKLGEWRRNAVAVTHRHCLAAVRCAQCVVGLASSSCFLQFAWQCPPPWRRAQRHGLAGGGQRHARRGAAAAGRARRPGERATGQATASAGYGARLRGPRATASAAIDRWPYRWHVPNDPMDMPPPKPCQQGVVYRGRMHGVPVAVKVIPTAEGE